MKIDWNLVGYFYLPKEGNEMKQPHKTRRSVFFWLIAFATMGALWGYALCLTVNAQTWDWSPPAPHHEAICIVRISAGRNQEGEKGWYRGSGVLVKYGELTGILTAAHMMNGKRIVVEYSDGTKSQVEAKDYTTDKFGHDLAFLFAITPGFIEPIAIAEQDPSVGNRVEFVTTGGPESRLRSFWAIVRSVANDTTEYNCDVLDGDSGGGILNAKGRLIGIQAYGIPPRIAESTSWTAYRGSGSVSCQPIRDFLGRIAKSKRCGPKGCPLPGNEQFYPPRSPAFRKPVWRPSAPIGPRSITPPAAGAAARFNPLPRRQLVPVEVSPPSTPAPLETPPHKVRFGPPEIDYDKLTKALLAKIDLDKLRGPVGPQGKPATTGKPGSRGQQGPAGSEAEHNLDEIADAVKKRISGSIRIKVTPISP